MITIFTPAYNRAHLLPRLYESLCKQNCKDFEWLVIDDGSTDSTESLFVKWKDADNGFALNYLRIENGGKQRAINRALDIANGEFFFIVDSDDYLIEDAISFIIEAFETLPDDDSFIGISVVRGDVDGKPINRIPKIDPEIGYVDCSNIDRPKYDLQADMAEVFFTNKLKKYRFPVWKGENFTPEAVVWDRIAMDGYKLRWFDKIAYLCEYQDDGLSKSSWSLLKRNPMGYAMLFNDQLEVNDYRRNRNDSLANGMGWVANTVMQFVSCCCLAGEYGYIRQCANRLAWLLALPGWLLSLRRRKQINSYSK